MSIKITKTPTPKVKPQNPLGFGKYFTDHLVTMEYVDGKWETPQIVPYSPFSLDPSTAIFHYGQGIFEGLKAYKDAEGSIRLFRTMDNLNRLNDSAHRLCIPQVDTKIVYEALVELIKLDADWIPTDEGTSLYIRPSIIGIDPALGVRASSRYIFFIILSPVGAYYEKGFSPIKLFVEENYSRAAKGGTGDKKVIGNYAASLKAAADAAEKGYSQVLWLDSNEHKYVEEVGAMNICFVFEGNKIVTPALTGSILPGITRRSILELASANGMAVEERLVSIEELVNGVKSGKCSEIFGTGTAAVVSPVGAFSYKGEEISVNGGKLGEITLKLYKELTGIQTGRIEDKFGWSIKI